MVHPRRAGLHKVIVNGGPSEKEGYLHEAFASLSYIFAIHFHREISIFDPAAPFVCSPGVSPKAPRPAPRHFAPPVACSRRPSAPPLCGPTSPTQTDAPPPFPLSWPPASPLAGPPLRTPLPLHPHPPTALRHLVSTTFPSTYPFHFSLPFRPAPLLRLASPAAPHHLRTLVRPLSLVSLSAPIPFLTYPGSTTLDRHLALTFSLPILAQKGNRHLGVRHAALIDGEPHRGEPAIKTP